MTKPENQWWVINGADLLAALKATHVGTSPDVMYLELLANSAANTAGE